MGSAFHQLCPRHSGTLTSTGLMAVRQWETFTNDIQNLTLVVISYEICELCKRLFHKFHMK